MQFLLVFIKTLFFSISGKMELSLYFYGFLYTKGNSKMVHFYCSHVTKQLLSTLNATSHVKRLEEALEASSLLYLRSSKRQRHLKYIVLHRRRRRSVATFFFFLLDNQYPLATGTYGFYFYGVVLVVVEWIGDAPRKLSLQLKRILKKKKRREYSQQLLLYFNDLYSRCLQNFISINYLFSS